MNLAQTLKTQSPILSRIAKGELDSFEDFINAYGNLVWSIAKKFTPNMEDAEDAVQEVFLEIWQHAARYDATKASEVTFISLLARRRLIDRVRKVYRQPNFQSLEETFETQPNVFETNLITNIEAKKAVQAMQTVRPEQRELMMLTIFEGMSHGEIAEKKQLPLGTVKTHIRRGFNSVRQIMSQKNFKQTALA